MDSQIQCTTSQSDTVMYSRQSDHVGVVLCRFLSGNVVFETHLVVRTLIPDSLYQQENQNFNDGPGSAVFPVAPMLCCSTQGNRYRHMSPHQHLGSACMRLEICPQGPGPASVLLFSICTALCPAICSEVGALGRLRQFLVGRCSHVSSDLDENGLHCEVAFPVCYAWELGEVDL
jgi:hypothetical protein